MNPAEFTYLAQAESDMWWFRGMNRMLFHFLDQHAGQHERHEVLEVGCGTGYLASLLRSRTGWRVTGLDLEPEALRFARNRLQRLVRGDMRHLPFSTASFSMLISMDVLVHLEKGRESVALAEFSRVIRPGGLLFLRVAALDVLRSRHSEFAHERQRFTRARLLPQLHAAGFEILRTTYMNSLLLPVALFKFRVWEPLTRQTPASGVYRYSPLLNRVLEWPLQLEARLLRKNIDLPLGQSLFVVSRKL